MKGIKTMTVTQIEATKKQFDELTEEYMREHDLVFMDYYRWRVLGTRTQVAEFAYEGMMYCEGSERERLMDIYIDATGGKLFCRDWGFYGNDDPYDGNRKLISWDAWKEE